MENGIVNIHGKEYQTVSYRVAKFREKYTLEKGWGIVTEILENTEKKVLIKALITRDGEVLAIGHAEEKREGRININAAIENCETSAIGRCLAAAGFTGEEYCTANELQNKLSMQQVQVPKTSLFQTQKQEPIITPKQKEKLASLSGELKMTDQDKIDLMHRCNNNYDAAIIELETKIEALKKKIAKEKEPLHNPAELSGKEKDFDMLVIDPKYLPIELKEQGYITGKWLATSKTPMELTIDDQKKVWRPRMILDFWAFRGYEYAKSLMRKYPQNHDSSYPTVIDTEQDNYWEIPLIPACLESYFQLSYEQGAIDRHQKITGKWLATYEDKVFVRKNTKGEFTYNYPRQLLHIWAHSKTDDGRAKYAKALLEKFPPLTK